MKFIQKLIQRYPDLAPIETDIAGAYHILKDAYENNRKLLVAGNGGSCADAEHIVGELMKGFLKKRPLSERIKTCLQNTQKQYEEALHQSGKALPKELTDIADVLGNSLQGSLTAIALNNHQGLNTAFANDVNADMTYAQQVSGYGRLGDVFLAISTSGNAKNLLYAALIAKASGLKIILLSGKDGGMLKELADVSIIVPSFETYEIQERHLPIYHALCLELEEEFF